MSDGAELKKLLQEQADRPGVANPRKPTAWARRTGSTQSILGDHAFDYLDPDPVKPTRRAQMLAELAFSAEKKPMG
jgi:hypothetical protein